MVTKITKIYNLGVWVSRKWLPDFEIQEIQELEKNSENQNTKKSTSTWPNVWIRWAENKNVETNFFVYEAKQLDENKQMALHDWISQVLVQRNNIMICTSYLA